MLKRLFSSRSLNCLDCRLYNRQTKLCRINNLSAINNRIDDNICGVEGNKYFPLDKTNLIKSQRCDKYQVISGLLTIGSLPILYNHVYCIGFTLSLFLVERMLSDTSRDFTPFNISNADFYIVKII